ncbi:MAG: NlpC/P60 family protein [Deltaproteobacteria bacterium]|nr:NlpC/P60 family protein [Deltaproteobacteria bacterium]
MTRLAAFGAVVCVLCASCRDDDAGNANRDSSCPEVRRVEPPLTNVAPEHEQLEYWLTRAETYGPLDTALLGPEEVRRHSLALREPVGGEPLGQADLLAPVDEAALLVQVGERLDYLREKLGAGTLVDAKGKALGTEALAAFEEPGGIELLREWRLSEALKPLRCGPYADGLYKVPIDLDFDRNRCSTIRPGEVVQLLARWPNGVYLARTPYALGWMDEKDLSGPLSAEALERELAQPEPPPFTRRAVLTEAFSLLGAPYGWGGKDGGYDCSRFLLELFGRFGVDLPRHSARQALAGTFSIDVSEVRDLNEKRLLLQAAARRGITLLHFPGHIMLYLGTTKEGVPMAMHAFSEYLTPCEGTELETVNRVDRVAISDLSLGEGSSRTDFLSRITRVTVIGKTPGPALAANAVLRPSAPMTRPEGACRDSQRHAIFRSPQRPNAAQPLRVIATSERDPGIASLVLYGPDGERIEAEEHLLDGPPFSRFVEVEQPTPGKWTAVLGEGDRTQACHRFVVAARKPWATPRQPIAPAWATTRRWSRSTENLYSAFIEQLFREPVDEDITWTRLQEVIGDPKRNLLYDYRLPGEDARLSLEPDCADLPYFLRAYFAWKLGVPFAYRTCTRGRKDAPPVCEPVVFSNLDPEEAATDVGAFRRFLRRMTGVVHSSSPRTRPNEEATDFYPLRLSRTAIRPGTVFADPYGHVLVVARWKPQGVDDYGVLIGADAQPDGTVGRRRFWRGSFLFTPKTDLVGAGFKGWRPVTLDPELQTLQIATNTELRAAGPVKAWSDAQYRGTADDFYTIMEGMINPRALDPVRMQTSLVDALEESVQRRLSSVQNGEDFMKSQGYATIEMPSGSALFLTSGPWEDYSTPSRDMRLLISIDAVTSFASTVAAHTGRFGIRDADRDAVVAEVKQALEDELGKRAFQYTRSDGSTWKLTLADLIDRTPAMEMAYNPNDCAEIRWSAPEGSEEHATCKRHAPEDQQMRMTKYRSWFATRERPH